MSLDNMGLFLSSLGKRLELMRPFRFFLLVFSIALIRTGIRGILPWPDFYPVSNFPDPTEHFSSTSLGMLALSHLFSANDKVSYFLLSLTISLLLVIVFTFWIYRRFGQDLCKLIILVFVLSPAFTILMGNIGRHDLLTIFGILFVALGSTRFAFVGAFLACLGSPEHAAVSFLFGFTIAKVLNQNQTARKYVLGFFATIVFWAIVTIWLASNQIYSNRIGNILKETDFFKISFFNFLASAPHELYSYFGALWPLVIIALVYMNKQQKLVFLTVILAAVIGNLFLVDKTRDFVIAILASFLVILLWLYDQLKHHIDNKEIKRFAYASLFLLMFFLPSIEVTFEGTTRTPFYWLLTTINKFLG
jgi:hypothetical protein